MHLGRSGTAGCLGLLLVLTLAGCSHRHLVSRTATSGPASVSHAPVLGEPVAAVATGARSSLASAQASPVSAPAFDDADPVDWPGATPAAYPVHGIDVSRWQPEIDWHTARAHGVSFAFIKATEGDDHADPDFPAHWWGAAAAGVPHGAYHFFHFCTSAEAQARWFIAHVPRERGALPPVLDVEWNAASRVCPQRPAPEQVRSEVFTFLSLVARHYGQQPIIYTTVDFWHENELWRVGAAQPWLRAVARHPSDAYPDVTWSFWQYSGTGLVPGIAGEVDLNAFAGPREAWTVWLATHTL